MVGVEHLEAGHLDAAGDPADDIGRRLVLEDEQRVEQLAVAGQPADLGEPEVLVVEQVGLRELVRDEHAGQRLARAPAHAHRQRVDEQAGQLLDAVDLRRAAGHGRPERDVVAAGELAEHESPRGLQGGAQGHPERAHAGAQLRP